MPIEHVNPSLGSGHICLFTTVWVVAQKRINKKNDQRKIKWH